MEKTLTHNQKTIDQNLFYKDALIYHLIHMGYKKELAIIKVEQMIRRQKSSLN